jgi:glycosyltransferase involved in cell wall biosynthesis
MLTPRQMTQLYELSDVFVYPTWGEGWGFNPMQAMAMGIPTITTAAWSDYAEYITIPIESHLFQSPWPDLHPGYMFKPNQKQLKKAMEFIKPNYKTLAQLAFKNSFEIHKNFNWEKVSAPAVEKLEKIFSDLELKK